jgi:hypothetical protein
MIDIFVIVLMDAIYDLQSSVNSNFKFCITLSYTLISITYLNNTSDR